MNGDWHTPLIEEILHQLIGSLHHYLQGFHRFSTYQVVQEFFHQQYRYHHAVAEEVCIPGASKLRVSFDERCVTVARIQVKHDETPNVIIAKRGWCNGCSYNPKIHGVTLPELVGRVACFFLKRAASIPQAPMCKIDI